MIYEPILKKICVVCLDDVKVCSCWKWFVLKVLERVRPPMDALSALTHLFIWGCDKNLFCSPLGLDDTLEIVTVCLYNIRWTEIGIIPAHFAIEGIVFTVSPC